MPCGSISWQRPIVCTISMFIERRHVVYIYIWNIHIYVGNLVEHRTNVVFFLIVCRYIRLVSESITCWTLSSVLPKRRPVQRKYASIESIVGIRQHSVYVVYIFD